MVDEGVRITLLNRISNKDSLTLIQYEIRVILLQLYKKNVANMFEAELLTRRCQYVVWPESPVHCTPATAVTVRWKLRMHITLGWGGP